MQKGILKNIQLLIVIFLTLKIYFSQSFSQNTRLNFINFFLKNVNGNLSRKIWNNLSAYSINFIAYTNLRNLNSLKTFSIKVSVSNFFGYSPVEPTISKRQNPKYHPLKLLYAATSPRNGRTWRNILRTLDLFDKYISCKERKKMKTVGERESLEAQRVLFLFTYLAFYA